MTGKFFIKFCLLQLLLGFFTLDCVELCASSKPRKGQASQKNTKVPKKSQGQPVSQKKSVALPKFSKKKDKERKECYVVPCDVHSKEIGSALKVLAANNVDQTAFQAEVARIFDARNMLNEFGTSSKQEGRVEGEIKGLMRNFIKSREIEDDEIEEIEKNSLDEAFIRDIWNELANTAQKDVDDFIQILRTKDLMKE
ncbi:MAG: hypothetical protein LBQ03_01845 [Puniceicoccales bacterium]|jgi:hypothetical protein|nr:hypothetical protein [Puniceicoccales bacterium]